MKKLIRNLSAMIFVFAMIIAWAPKSYAARNIYTFQTSLGENYKVIAEVNGDNVEIVGAPFNLVTESCSGNLASGNSFYNVITSDYETTYNGAYDDTGLNSVQINEKLKGRAKDVLKLLQFYINAQETKDDNMSTIKIKFGDGDLISGRGATYAYGKSGSTSYDKIITNVSTISKANPYGIIVNTDPPIYNSEKITVGDQKLKDIYDDVMLIKLYEKALQKPSWIKKEETSESQITVDGYLLQVDKSMMDTNGEIYVKVVDSMGTQEYASFLLAEKQRVGNKYKEVTYVNEKGRKVKWYEKGGYKGLTTGTGSVNTSQLLYYQSINGSRRTLDYYQTAGKLDLTDKTAFIAIRNSDSRSVFVYADKLNNEVQNVTLIGTVDIDSIGEDLSLGSLSVTTGDWVLDKNGTKIMIYREGTSDPDTECYYVDLDKMFQCYTKQSSYFDICLPVTKGIYNQFDTSFNNTPGTYLAFISTSKTVLKRETTNPMVIFENAYLDSQVPMDITIVQVPEGNENDGSEFGKKVDITKLISNKNTSELPPKLTFKEIIKEEDAKQVVGGKTAASGATSRIGGGHGGGGHGSRGGIGEASTVTEADTVSFSEAFLTDTVSIGKNILMILIFCALVAAGFRHALKGSTDPKEREKTKITLKNILVGILIFICLSLIVTLIWDYTYKGLDAIQGAIGQQAEQEFENEDEITRQSLLLDIIEVILKVLNEIEAGIIEILAKTLTGDAVLTENSRQLHFVSSATVSGSENGLKAAGINYISLIYNVYAPDGSISSMMPYDAAGVEWSRILSGYNMLVSVAFTVLIFAIAVTACQYIIFAGNAKKITAVKQRFVRMFWAALLLITVPYLVQFMLYIFNYLTAAVPINWDDPKFEIDIGFDGALGEIARNLFLTTQLNIYMTFLVRHVMLSVLLISGPIVIVAWAIYERFRSFPVWFGELFTNIAMQFCYAVGFMVVIFLSYEGQNPVYGLILISVSMGLSKFIKESLQGYFQEGAGINEEGEASSIVKMAFGWANKAKAKTKKFGKGLQRVSKKMDNDQTTKSGVAVGNVGKVLAGDWSKVTTKNQRLKNVENKAKKNARGNLEDDDENDEDKKKKKSSNKEIREKKQKKFDDYMNDPNILEQDKEEVMEYFDKLEHGNVKVIRTGKGFDEANELSRANQVVYRDEERDKIEQINKFEADKKKETVLEKDAKETTEQSLLKGMTAEQKKMLKDAQDSPEDVIAKIETKHQETAQAIAQLDAIDNIHEKEMIIDKCEANIMALAAMDAMANDARMQEDLAMLLGKLTAYKAEKMRNAGIKINDNQLRALEEAMLARMYSQNEDDKE